MAAVMEITSPKPMVFAGFYPFDAGEHSKLKNAISKVALNDSSVHIEVESSAVLGMGWRLGFLGVLHMEVFSQRLEQVIRAPSLNFYVVM